MKRITLSADTAKLNDLIGFIRGELEGTACPEKVKQHIELAAEEIFVNIARYAYDYAGGEVEIDCEIDLSPLKNTIHLVFSDRGRQYNPLEHTEPDISLPLEDRSIGGLGIFMIKRTMDTVEYAYDKELNRLAIGKSW
jgi:anti-sigma regulatory factor (Ser/Thr protein kinase)